MPVHICQNKKCTGSSGRPSESAVYFDWGPRGEFCSEECLSEALNVPTMAEQDFHRAVFEELRSYRQREDSNAVRADAWVWWIVDIICAKPVRNSGRAAGQKNEMPDWPEKPHSEASEAAKRLHLYQNVIRAVVRDFASYTLDAPRRAECEARKVALALDWQGLRDADKAADEALEWHWQANDPIRDIEYGCELAELRYRREERERRQRPARDPRLHEDHWVYPC
jgi:hypothetical protein